MRYALGMEKEARAIGTSVERTLDAGIRTRDIGGQDGTVEFGDHVAKTLKEVLSGGRRLKNLSLRCHTERRTLCAL
jgi:hypothetical protein